MVTSTLAGLFAEAAWAGGTAGHATTLRRAGAVVTMGAGAVVGAFLLRIGLAVAVALPALVLLMVGAGMLVRVVRHRRAERAPAAGIRDVGVPGDRSPEAWLS